MELWVLEAQAGSRDAFSALCLHFYPSAISFGVKLCGQLPIAEDATHNALIRLSKTITRLEDPAAINSWIFKLVRWQVLDIIKHESRYQALQPSDLQQVTAMAEDDSLTQAIASLPKIEGQVIHLFYLEGLSAKEIGNVLEIPTGTVKSRLFRARERLKQALVQILEQE
ncbi:RNA polymerase sigma factor [Shewanella sp. MBTL60-007]|uniref:RNA polymerase sigma factor n=1 Tax=Shewanella sp. MBTL60-007 TaxID=2815911 RepID=UPI00217FADEF|nr:RNA polymerase sigma factor [Shewanella sp. MBTL60-007]